MNKLAELGQKLQSGELDTSNIKSTHCIKDDPTVGLNIWEAGDKADFDKKFEPHKKYYAEVMEITPVIPVEESQKILMEQMAGVR
jgi:hypothetical protein